MALPYGSFQRENFENLGLQMALILFYFIFFGFSLEF